MGARCTTPGTAGCPRGGRGVSTRGRREVEEPPPGGFRRCPSRSTLDPHGDEPSRRCAVTATTQTSTAPGVSAGLPTPAVVVGSDGGVCALEAVRWAAAEAALRGAPLRIVHAAPHLRPAGGTGSL